VSRFYLTLQFDLEYFVDAILLERLKTLAGEGLALGRRVISIVSLDDDSMNNF